MSGGPIIRVEAYEIAGVWHASLLYTDETEQGERWTATLCRLESGILNFDDPLENAWSVLWSLLRTLEAQNAPSASHTLRDVNG